MTKKFIVVDYDGGKSEEPKLAFESVGLDSALEKFEKLKTANQTRSVVLFNTLSGEVKKIAILGEPIYLAKALTFARTFVQNKSLLTKLNEGAAKAAAGAVIGEIAKAIAGGPIPGVGGVVLGHFIAPYYAFKGDNVAVAKAASGMYGGLSGAVIGFVVGGPIGAVVGGAIGGIGMAEGAGAIVKVSTKHPKCETCSGTGLVDYYEVCKKCKGYGYRK
ncbi:uncharacterized protein LOC132740365 [Ruditapes philippinarum]|uniref:uncharacterized protein LOC132740365 n=1 Tax=Ruditapes philippinarum TaxID=129788 RepID=UPI00295B4AAD|nr:uncharacterized protein LOC132740365 [Ruditapes philippinarum]